MGYRSVQTGERVAEYLLEEKIGEDRFGEVWKARQADIPNRLVAVRILRNPCQVERLRSHALLPSKISHPNIVKILELDLDTDPPCLVMEHIDGKNLRTLLATEGIVPPPYAIDIAAQILDALHQAHENGIVHKNIRPETVLIEKKLVELKDGRKTLLYWVKLDDLGLGCLEDNAGKPLHAFDPGGGLPYYLAPEQTNPDLQVDRRADLYAVGVLLYEMLTGVLPLGVDLPSELNPVVPKDLDRIVKRALHVDRDLRYSNAAEMRQDLTRAKEALVKELQDGRDRLGIADGTAGSGPQKGIVRSHARKRFPTLIESLQGTRGPQRTALVVAGSVIVVLLGLLLLVVFLRPPVPSTNPASSKPPSPASLRISTEPDGVEVQLDGIKLGTTPLKIEPISFEPHQIRLTLPFHRNRVLQLLPHQSDGRRAFRVRDPELDSELFVIEFSDTASIDRLLLDREHGSLRVETPGVEGVRVYLEDEFHGTTPVMLNRVPAGVYRLKLRKDGYRAVELPVTVLGDSKITLPILMRETERAAAPAPSEAPSELCEVTILTDPDGARVLVDGEEQGGWTPTVLQLPPGLRRLRVEKEYYEPQQVDLSFSSPKGGQVGFRLVRLRASMHVTSEPAGAKVFLNDRLYGQTPVRIDGIEAGTYLMRFVKEGYRPHLQEIEVKGGQGEVVHAVLDAAAPSAIRVRASVRGLAIYLDHQRMGQTGDGWTRIPATPGRHIVVIGGNRFEVHVPEGGEAIVEASESDLGMVWVEGGSFRYGAKLAQGTVALKEKIVHVAGFWIDKHEVTNAQYRVFLEYLAITGDHSGCHRGEPKQKDHAPKVQYWLDANFNGDDQPVVGVDYFDAWSYAAWAGKMLPTEVQWEKAARGVEGLEYPWGSEWKPKALNYGDFRGRRNPDESDGHSFTAPVGSYLLGVSPYGCYEMAGNVAEWCRERFDASGELIVVRGGSWIHTDPEQFKVWRRDSARIHDRGQSVGFRCVVEK